MDHYIDIRLLEDPDIPAPVLMSTLFTKLHKVLASHGNGQVGISFPLYDKTLGSTLRLHGTRTNLVTIMDCNWLAHFASYTSIGTIRQVPDKCQHRSVQRVQSKSSRIRLYRRSVRKGWMTEEEAEEQVKLENGGKHLSEPFISLRSMSTGQKFKLFVRHGPIRETSVEGSFSAYGLSPSTTIPWF